MKSEEEERQGTYFPVYPNLRGLKTGRDGEKEDY